MAQANRARGRIVALVFVLAFLLVEPSLAGVSNGTSKSLPAMSALHSLAEITAQGGVPMPTSEQQLAVASARQRIDAASAIGEKFPGMQLIKGFFEAHPNVAASVVNELHGTPVMSAFNKLVGFDKPLGEIAIKELPHAQLNLQLGDDVHEVHEAVDPTPSPAFVMPRAIVAHAPELERTNTGTYCGSTFGGTILVTGILLLTAAAFLLQQLRSNSLARKRLFDYDALPAGMKHWEEWHHQQVLTIGGGSSAKENDSASLSGHLITEQNLKRVLSMHLRKRGVNVGNKELDALVTLLPANAVAGARGRIAQLLEVAQSRSQLDEVVGSRQMEQITNAVLIKLISKGAWKQWSTQCINIPDALGQPTVIVLLNDIFTEIDLRQDAVVTGEHLKRLVELEAQLKRVVELGREQDIVATNEVISSAALLVGLSPRLIRTIATLMIDGGGKSKTMSDKSRGKFIRWQTVECAFSAVSFVREVVAKFWATRFPKTSFSSQFYKHPREFAPSVYETPRYNMRMWANTLTSGPSVVLGGAILAMLAVAIKLVFFSATDILPPPCSMASLALPQVRVDTVSQSRVTLFWKGITSCHAQFLDSLELQEANGKFSMPLADFDMCYIDIAGLQPGMTYQVQLLGHVNGITDPIVGPVTSLEMPMWSD